MWPWHVKMTTQNLLRLLLLLMLMMRNVLTTVWCKFGRWSLVIKLSFCSDFEHKVSRFGQDFKVDVQARFWSWSLVIVLLLMLHVVMKFNLGQDSEARFGQDFEAQVLWRGWCLVEILKMMLGRDSEDEIWSRFVFELVIRTQPSGPLCLWQCFYMVASLRTWDTN